MPFWVHSFNTPMPKNLLNPTTKPKPEGCSASDSFIPLSRVRHQHKHHLCAMVSWRLGFSTGPKAPFWTRWILFILLCRVLRSWSPPQEPGWNILSSPYCAMGRQKWSWKMGAFVSIAWCQQLKYLDPKGITPFIQMHARFELCITSGFPSVTTFVSDRNQTVLLHSNNKDPKMP